MVNNTSYLLNRTFQNRTFKYNLIHFGDKQEKENNNTWVVNRNELVLHSDNFSYPIDENYCAILQFSKDSESGVYNFYHVEVPQVFKGKGIAMPFAKACFDHALENNWKVKVTCTYLKRKFLGEFKKDYERILIE